MDNIAKPAAMRSVHMGSNTPMSEATPMSNATMNALALALLGAQAMIAFQARRIAELEQEIDNHMDALDIAQDALFESVIGP
jgi:hypothetical protein